MPDQKMNSIPDTWAVDSNGESNNRSIQSKRIITNRRSKRIWINDDG